MARSHKFDGLFSDQYDKFAGYKHSNQIGAIAIYIYMHYPIVIKQVGLLLVHQRHLIVPTWTK